MRPEEEQLPGVGDEAGAVGERLQEEETVGIKTRPTGDVTTVWEGVAKPAAQSQQLSPAPT